MIPESQLPYHDTKPVGAADFYFAIQATFRFVLAKMGHPGWVRYLEDMARTYFAPVNANWTAGGIPAVAAYWRDFFAAEPGGDVTVTHDDASVTIEVRVCPMIAHLRTADREPLACLCQHCFYLNDARAATAGLAMRLQGGNGSCRHTYTPRATTPPQDLAAIEEFRSC